MFWLFLYFVLFLVTAFLSIANRSFNKIKYMLLILVVGIIAYHTIPLYSDDLFRYFEEMNRISLHSLEWTMENGIWKSTSLSNLILYFFAKYNIERVLPVITATFLIALFAFIMCKELKKHTEYHVVALAFVELVFGAFLDVYLVMNIVRNTFAMGFFVLIVYLDYRQKIKNPLVKILLYALLPLFHSSMLPIIITVFFTKTKLSSRVKFFAIIISPFFMQTFIDFLGNLGIDFFSTFSQKAESNIGKFTMGQSWILTLITIAATILIMLVLTANLKKAKIEHQDSEQKYIELLLSLALAMLSLFFVSQALLFRLFPMVMLLSSPYVYKYAAEKKDNNVPRFIICGALLLCSSVRWVFQYVNYFSIWQLSI